ncbi:hypothetical protein OJ996_10470 [Luteolibacter sp. GHJ8]|uniref:Secreted protein n=1 Tax=Luteolibacter rhizosphaerae TaxID=2989719 RepID=A0ABT3G2D3_9BACT|nr:hypothetical protein [Luteolibacter rhizosphaerae]MCW1914001.1 hypothetical protein [Luteolibacter rhizosphaerae]
MTALLPLVLALLGVTMFAAVFCMQAAEERSREQVETILPVVEDPVGDRRWGREGGPRPVSGEDALNS